MPGSFQPSLALFLLSLIVSPSNGQEENTFNSTLHGALFGKKLLGGLITKLTGLDLKSCVRECSTRPRCRSVNYFQKMLLCELNNKRKGDETLLTNHTGSIYITVDSGVMVS